MAREATTGEQQGSGYLVGDDVRALFAGALNFREQCDAADSYNDLNSDDEAEGHGMVEGRWRGGRRRA